MKRIIFTCLVLSVIFSLNRLALAQDIQAASNITQVTVYPGDVLITRTAVLKAESGEHKIIFADIIPEIDENSLRVSAGGNALVKVLGVELKKKYLEETPQEKVKKIQDQIQGLEDDKRRLNDEIRALGDEKQFLDSVRLFSTGQIPKDLVTRMPPAKELDDTLKFLSLRIKENYNKVVDADLSMRELDKKIQALRQELSEVQGPGRKLVRSIEAQIEVDKPGNLDLSVSYLARGASWQPLYDARANFDKSEVELVSQGIIRQNTGEDWTDVVVYLSTAKPAIGGSLPYVNSWILRPYQPRKRDYDYAEKAEIRMLKGTMQTEAFKSMDAAVGASMPLMKEKEIYSEAQEKGTAVVYKLARKATIKSDNADHKLPISSQILAAKFEYSSYPRAVLNAYLGSRVTNAKDLQLLGGKVNIFLDGDFVGNSSIGNIGPGEEFDLYLGADDNVKVKREQIEKKVDETLIAGIPSPTKKTVYQYKLTVENYKSKKINVKLFEAMPVSEDDRIKAKVDKVSLEPNKKDWKDRKGVWLWELELEPKAKKEILYSLTVEQPREMIVEGL
jgi:uncharacterized protein (TIGR02231 family)